MQNNIPKSVQNAMKNSGVDPNRFSEKDAQKLINSLSKEDTQKLNSVLQNKQALQQVLNSNQAKSIMNALFGEK